MNSLKEQLETAERGTVFEARYISGQPGCYFLIRFLHLDEEEKDTGFFADWKTRHLPQESAAYNEQEWNTRGYFAFKDLDGITFLPLLNEKLPASRRYGKA